jgi:hypothetical protein
MIVVLDRVRPAYPTERSSAVRRTVLILLTLAASLLIAGQASAAIRPLELYTPEGGAVPVGGQIVASSTSLKLTLEPGKTVECDRARLAGTLSNNDATTDKAAIKEASFTGVEGKETPCTSTGLGNVTVDAARLAWTMSLSGTGVAQIHKTAFTLVFPELGGMKCNYQAFTVKGKFGIPDEGVVTFANQSLKVVTKTSGKGCAPEVVLNVTVGLDEFRPPPKEPGEEVILDRFFVP